MLQERASTSNGRCFFYAHLKEGGAIPSRPNTPCRHPGCAALVPYGTKYCDLHKPLHPEENRRLALGRQVCVQQEDRGAESGRLLCDHHGGFQEVPVCGGFHCRPQCLSARCHEREQGQNRTYLAQLKAVGWEPSKITVACEAEHRRLSEVREAAPRQRSGW